MSEEESVWHYTHNGESKGPVTIELLRGLVQHKKISLEKDLVWGPGLNEWSAIKDVPELIESLTEQVELAEVSPKKPKTSISSITTSAKLESNNLAQIPKSPSPVATTEEEDDNALSEAMEERRRSEKPAGMGRAVFFITSIGSIVFFLVTSIYTSQFLAEKELSYSVIAVAVASILLLLIQLKINFSRLINLEMSRWNVLWLFVPIIDMWLCFRLYFCPAGYASHKKLDSFGRVFLILFLLVTIGSSWFFSNSIIKIAEEASKVGDQEIEGK